MNYLDIKKKILEEIKNNDKIVIVRHVRPDGDCMGSSIGLREILRATYPNKEIYSIGNDKEEYLSIVGLEDKEISDYSDFLVIAVDTANRDRISNSYYQNAKKLIKIDHHINVEEYGDVNYVREDMPAASCIIVDFYNTFKDELILNKKAAEALFIGIVTDTGRFKYRGVNGDILRLTSILLDFNLDIETIYTKLYVEDVGLLKLKGEVLNNFKITDNGVSYMDISLEMQKKYGLTPTEAAALVNALDSIKGSLIWIAFIEQIDGSIRVRLRSRFVNIVNIASKYHGGGHPQACGATVYNEKEKYDLLEDSDILLKEYKENNTDWI